MSSYMLRALVFFVFVGTAVPSHADDFIAGLKCGTRFTQKLTDLKSNQVQVIVTESVQYPLPIVDDTRLIPIGFDASLIDSYQNSRNRFHFRFVFKVGTKRTHVSVFFEDERESKKIFELNFLTKQGFSWFQELANLSVQEELADSSTIIREFTHFALYCHPSYKSAL